MSPRAVRRIVLAVCVAGIAGMIVSSINDNNGAALTAGLLTAVAVLCLIVATAVTAHDPARVGAAAGDDPEELGARVERGVQDLVGAGADEQRVRALVGDALRLGRAGQPRPPL
jgi:hypothetical protein